MSINLKALSHNTGLSTTEIAQICSIKIEKLESADNICDLNNESLNQLVFIVETINKCIIESPSLWFDASNELLNNKTPKEALLDGDLIRVAGLVAGVEYGHPH